MATKEKSKLTQAEKAVLKEEKKQDIQPEIEQKEPWWRKVLNFFSRVVDTIKFYLSAPFRNEKVVVDTDALRENEVFEKAKKEMERQQAELEKKRQQETDRTDEEVSEHIEIDTNNAPEEGIDNTTVDDTIVEDADEIDTTVEDENKDEANGNAITEDVEIEPTSDNTGGMIIPEITEDTLEEEVDASTFETTKCENFEGLQVAINGINEAIVLSTTDNGKLILAVMEEGNTKSSVEFTMDELNAEGLSECVGIPLADAKNIAMQMEENTNIIKSYLDEKRVNIMVAELDQRTIESTTDLRVIAQQLCSNQDGIKNVTMSEMDDALLFHMNTGAYDAEKGECTEDVITLNLVKGVITRSREFTDWSTMRNAKEETELTASELPASIRAIYQLAQKDSVKSLFSPVADTRANKGDAFPTGSEVLDDYDENQNRGKQHKKTGNHRREQAQVRAFEDAMNSGKKPQTKAEKREERRAENAAKRKAEMRAREEDAR